MSGSRGSVLGVLLAGVAITAACSADASTADPPPDPPSTSSTPSGSQPTPSPSSDPKSKAVAAAKARYLSAIAGRTLAVHSPEKATEAALVASGNADPWLGSILSSIAFYRDNKLYETGALAVTSMRETKVVLTGEQPEVQLDVCGDNSAVQLRYRSNNQAAPTAPGNKVHPRFKATLRYAPAIGISGKRWYVVHNSLVGSC